MSNLTRTRHQLLPISLAKMNVIDGVQKGVREQDLPVLVGAYASPHFYFLEGGLKIRIKILTSTICLLGMYQGIHWMTFQKHVCKRMLLLMMFLIAEKDMGFVK